MGFYQVFEATKFDKQVCALKVVISGELGASSQKRTQKREATDHAYAERLALHR